MIFDAHSDIWIKCLEERTKGNVRYFEDVHYSKLKKGNVIGSINVFFTNPERFDHKDNSLWKQIGIICEQINDLQNIKDIIIATDYNHIIEAINNNKYFIILGIEGLCGLYDNVEQIALLHRIGVRHASLTWNDENSFATGVGSENSNRGVTSLGEKAIRLMEKLGMILDVSHLNEKSFWDITEIAKKPFIASHSNSKTLCNHRRNLTDSQAKAIVKSGGVIGINMCGVFLNEDLPSLNYYLDHIEYFVNIVGIDGVGIGFDFCDFLRDDAIDDEDEYFKKKTLGLETVEKAGSVLEGLRMRGFASSDIEKIAYKNFLRVFSKVL